MTTAMLVPSSRFTRSSTSSTSRPVCGVERAGGLVAEQDLGLLDDRARDRDPLLLAAGHLRRVVIAPRRQPDELQRVVG